MATLLTDSPRPDAATATGRPGPKAGASPGSAATSPGLADPSGLAVSGPGLAATERPRADLALPAKRPLPRRLGGSRRLMHHNRLVALVVGINLVVLGYGLTAGGWWRTGEVDLAAISAAALANLALAILIRQQYVVNLLFWLATRAPTSWPLWVRAELAKVYHHGGLHVGGAVVGSLWFAVLTGSLLVDVVTGAGGASPTTVALSGAVLAVLALLVLTALPTLRARRHDRFERVHRFGGWTVLALFWAQTISSVADAAGGAPTAGDLLRAPAVWLLVVLTGSIALPWLRLRRVPVEIDRPSSHVSLARFNHGVTPFAGSSTAVSRDPLREWHSFANVPTPGELGFRLTISRAGDWTGEFNDDPPTHVWVKGIPTAGVANIEKLFSKVVYVATGSGIGPCLPHLLAGEVPAHLVWATRSPRATYGDALVDELLAVQPDATIWDTTENGKPDMVALAYAAWRATGAEAVICISNPALTWRVVEGLEQRGIPAYGAIWDS